MTIRVMLIGGLGCVYVDTIA